MHLAMFTLVGKKTVLGVLKPQTLKIFPNVALIMKNMGQTVQ